MTETNPVTQATVRHADLSPEQKARMPNLFLIGAGKCGTTSLHSYLSEHPEIAGAREKEPSFFVAQEELREWQLMESMRPEAHDLEAYLDLFPRSAANQRYRLESSPTYSSYPDFTGIPERIAAASPDARIIFLIRHPTDRAISHYWQDRKILKESRSLTEALSGTSIYTTSSDYKLQLDQYAPYFDNILLVRSEELRSDPQGVLSRLFADLGLEDHVLATELLGERNTTPDTTRMPRLPIVTRLRDTALWNRIRARLPKGALQAIRKLTVKDVPRSKDEEAAMRARLDAQFSPMIEALDRDYGTDFHGQWFRSN